MSNLLPKKTYILNINKICLNKEKYCLFYLIKKYYI